MEEDHPENCKADARCEVVGGEPGEGEEEDGPEDNVVAEEILEDDEDYAGEKPHEVDAGDEVKSKEDKIESCIESVDRHHHHKAQLGRNQTVENRELLKSIEEQGHLNNHFSNPVHWVIFYESQTNHVIPSPSL